MKGKRILVATDLSENARPAARTGAELGEMLSLEVEVIHVFDPSLWRNRKFIDVVNDPALRDRLRDRVATWFEEAAGKKADSLVLEIGVPDEVIRKRASAEDVAGLVITMSGRGAWNKLVFGSTALKLTSPPPCELVIVHPDGANFVEGMSLGLGTDFSETSDAALAEAVWLAEKFNSPLYLIYAHALPSTTVITEGELPPGMKTTNVINWAEDAMNEYVARHEKLLDRVDFEAHVVTDYPVSGLRNFVEEFGIEWLVLGHRTPGQRRGSATVKGKWVQQMNCSTLLVPVAPG